MGEESDHPRPSWIVLELPVASVQLGRVGRGRITCWSQPGDHVMLESGDHVMLESADHVMLESGDHVILKDIVERML